MNSNEMEWYWACNRRPLLIKIVAIIVVVFKKIVLLLVLQMLVQEEIAFIKPNHKFQMRDYMKVMIVLLTPIG